MDVQKRHAVEGGEIDAAEQPVLTGSEEATDVGGAPDPVDPGGGAAERAATALCAGFQAHDDRERERAVEAFAAVDAYQFAHVEAATVRRAAEAYVDALWAKDAVEDGCRTDGEIDESALATADWSPVENALAERAALLDVDPEYAALTTEGWRRHKVGGDYWTPHLRAQQLELQAALRDPEYPSKPSHGRSGAGPEATRYLLGVELHDTRQWREARAVMVPYFERIGRARDSGDRADPRDD